MLYNEKYIKKSLFLGDELTVKSHKWKNGNLVLTRFVMLVLIVSLLVFICHTVTFFSELSFENDSVYIQQSGVEC